MTIESYKYSQNIDFCAYNLLSFCCSVSRVKLNGDESSPAAFASCLYTQPPNVHELTPFNHLIYSMLLC